MGKIYQVLIGCIVALLPLYIQISSVDLGRISKSNALLFLLPLVLIFMGNNVRKLETYFKLIFSYFVVSMLLNQLEPALASGTYQNICISMLGAFIIFYAEKAEKKAEWLLNWMATGAIIQSVLVVFQLIDIELYVKLVELFFGNLNIQDTGHAPSGSLGNPNILGSYIAIAFPVFLSGARAYFLPIIIAALFASKSEMAYLAAGLGSAYYLLCKSYKRELLSYVLFPAIFFPACYFFKDKISGRWQIWDAALSGNTLSDFIFGKSSSWLTMQKMDVKEAGRILHEHNDFISLFNMFGIVGVFLVGIVLFQIIKNSGKDKTIAAVLFSGFVNMQGHFPMHIAPTAFLIILALGHCLIKDTNGSNLDR